MRPIYSFLFAFRNKIASKLTGVIFLRLSEKMWRAELKSCSAMFDAAGIHLRDNSSFGLFEAKIQSAKETLSVDGERPSTVSST